MSYNSDLQANNAELQAILNTVNALPDANSGEMVMKSGNFAAADLSASIDTGLSSISFFMLSKTSFAEVGFINGYFKPTESRYLYCQSYSTYTRSVVFGNSTTLCTFENGIANFATTASALGLTSGKEYVWYAFGFE